MNNYRNGIIPADRPLGLAFIVLLGFLVLGMLLTSSLTALIMNLMGVSFSEIQQMMSGADDGAWGILMFMQGVTALGLFVITPYVYIRYFLNTSVKNILVVDENLLKGIVLTTVVTFSFMVVNSFFVEWNQNFQFPEFMKSFEDYAQRKEQELADLTTFLTSFNSIDRLLIALLVIAVLPAVGEELLFRGVMQSLFVKIFNNPHIAIWVTGFIFGAIHIQFYGLVPRALLGIVFGYLFHYSGSLIYPMIAHFINNGLSLIMMYLYNTEISQFDLENTESIPIYTILIFLVVFLFALRTFILNFKPNKNIDG